MAHEVFISYVLEDGQIAQTICRHLEENGIRCWMAPRDILPGRMWAESIEKAITESKLLVLIFSTGSNGSVAVMNEINLASDGKIPILTFRLENIPTAGGLRYYLGTSHWLDATTQPLENHLSHLLNSIKIFAPETSRIVSEAAEHETRIEAKINAEPKAKIEPEVSAEPQIKVAPEITAQSKPKDESKAIAAGSASAIVLEGTSERSTSILNRFKEWCNSLFGFNLSLLKIEGTFNTHSEVVKNSAITAAVGIIVVFCLMVLMVQSEFLVLASVKFIFGLIALCLAAWVLASLVRTHLVYGSICGGLALIFISGLLAFHNAFLVEKSFRMTGLIIVCVVMVLIAFFTCVGSALVAPVLWITGGLISGWCFFQTITLLYWGFYLNYFDPYENTCYRLIALSSLFGIGAAIYGILENRKFNFILTGSRRGR